MFISRKKIKAIETRLLELEHASEINTWDFGKVSIQDFARKIENELREIKKAASGN